MLWPVGIFSRLRESLFSLLSELSGRLDDDPELITRSGEGVLRTLEAGGGINPVRKL